MFKRFAGVGAWRGAVCAGTPATVIVPSHRHAHQFRKYMGNRASGVQFLTLLDLAEEVLLFAGDDVRTRGEEDWSFRLKAVFSGKTLEGRLKYFVLEQIRRSQGFEEAFANTFLELA